MSDVSSVVNYFSTAFEGFVTTLGSSILAGATTVPLTTTSGLTNGAVFVGMIEPGLTKQQVFTGIVDTGGAQITGVVWTRGTNADHTAGVTIVDYVTGTAHNMTSTGVLKEHNQDGSHKTSLSLVTPKVTTGLTDTNGNETVRTPATASAVNDITVTNATTGQPPEVAASGDDTNVHMVLKGKGTGLVLAQIPIYTTAVSYSGGIGEAVAGTINIPSFPVAVKVNLMGYCQSGLGSGVPTITFLNLIRRGTTIGGTQIGGGDNTKSSATGISETRTTSLVLEDNVAANTAQSYVWTTNGAQAASGFFMAIVTAQ